MIKYAAAALGSLVGAMCLSGCAFTAFSTAPAPADGHLRVVAGLYPLQWVTQQVVGDLAPVESLTQPGQEPHDIELTPREVGAVATASLVVYEKGLQAAVDQAVAQTHPASALDVGPVAGLEPLSHGGHDQTGTALGTTQDTETEQSAKALDGLDPHFWQDPHKLAAVGRAIARRMSTIDPAHAATYAANDARLQRRLATLDHEYAAGLAHCARHTIVVSHNAFGYLWRYGIDVEAIAGLSPDAEPTPADIGRLQDLIHRDAITTVFGERLVPAALSEQIAHDTGARTAVLDPIEGLTNATSHDTYLTLMHSNLEALRKANACR